MSYARSPFSKLIADFMPKLDAMEHRFVHEGGLLMAGSDPTGFGGVVQRTSAAGGLPSSARSRPASGRTWFCSTTMRRPTSTPSIIP